MKRTIFILATTLFMAIGFYSCTSADEKLSKQVASLMDSYPDAKVAIKDGVATISGTVDGESTKGQITDLVAKVVGVKSVVNNIDVKSKIVINPDQTISSGIATALTAAGFKDVLASVKDGEVTLTGDLKRADLIKVMQVVNATSPKKVNNKLNLK